MIIDVSKWQGAIDWGRVRAAGVTRVIIRATLGATGKDERFAANWAGARAAGIAERGVYHYVITGVPAAAQWANLKGVTGGDWGTLPITLDAERTTAERDAMAGGWVFPRLAYTRMLQELVGLADAGSGRNTALYTSRNEWQVVTTSPEWALTHPLHIAHYWAGAAPLCPPGWGWTTWQYTSVGSVDGIAGHVDLSRPNPLAPNPNPIPIPDLESDRTEFLARTAELRELVNH